jgi:hypothetical protein
MCVMGHIVLCGAWGMKSGFHNVGFFHISLSSISSASLTAGSHFYTCRNESVMRLGGREDRTLPRMVCTWTLTSLIEHSGLFRSIFHGRGNRSEFRKSYDFYSPAVYDTRRAKCKILLYKEFILS